MALQGRKQAATRGVFLNPVPPIAFSQTGEGPQSDAAIATPAGYKPPVGRDGHAVDCCTSTRFAADAD